MLVSILILVQSSVFFCSDFITEKSPVLECYLDENGKEYTGKRAITKDGRKCLKWADHPNEIFWKVAKPQCMPGLSMVILCCLKSLTPVFIWLGRD